MKMKNHASALLAVIAGLIVCCSSGLTHGEEEEATPQNNVIPAIKKAIGPGEFYWLMDRACYHGDEMSVQMLLNAGAEPDGVNDYKEFARFEPIWHLTQAAHGGHLEIVDMLLRAGATVDLPSGEGHTALFMAVIGNHPKVVKRLLEAGANTTIKVNGDTVSGIAKSKGFDDIVSILESAAQSKPKSEQNGARPGSK
jgi:hypothetical protein